MGEFGNAADLYFGGDMEAGIALTGQVCGRIEEIKPVEKVLRETVEEFFEIMGDLAARYT
jgi:enoyl-[acyl-carrier protein] reductase II